MMKLYILNVWVTKELVDLYCIDLNLSLWSETHSSVKNANIVDFSYAHNKSRLSVAKNKFVATTWASFSILDLFQEVLRTIFKKKVIHKRCQRVWSLCSWGI